MDKITETNSTDFLTVTDLSVEYTSEGNIVKAVNNVSFSMRRGSTLGFVGETGAGKTTIAKAIMRILPDVGARITGGSVEFEGNDLMLIREKEMAKLRGSRLSMIFQDPMTALNPVMPVGDQIAEGIRLHTKGINKLEAYKRACDMLEMVGIPAERYGEYPHQFSGGMKQRVVIAIALACGPELLIADEPTTALDVTIQAQVLEMINDLKARYETSMILITHDLGVVAEMCDDVAVIYAGEIVEYGSLRDIFKSAKHPYTVGLFDALPNIESDEEWLKPIAGLPPDPTNLPDGCKFGPRCPHATEACLSGDIPLASVGGKHLCRCIRFNGEEK